MLSSLHQVLVFSSYNTNIKSISTPYYELAVSTFPQNTGSQPLWGSLQLFSETPSLLPIPAHVPQIREHL